MKQQRTKPTTDELIRAIREGCLAQARIIQEKLDDAIRNLAEGNHLSALGALTGTEEEMNTLLSTLKLAARLSVRKAGGLSNLLDEPTKTHTQPQSTRKQTKKEA